MKCLNDGDFGKFIKHLEGLMMVYDLKGGQNISAPQKSIAWNALSILERDLEILYNSYRYERTHKSILVDEDDELYYKIIMLQYLKHITL